MDAADIQRRHFARIASQYDSAHLGDEHDFALEWLCGCLSFTRATSLLDVGAGTGRAIRQIATRFPNLHVCGVEPVAQMREIGHGLGLSPQVLVDGDAKSLPFASKSIDIVAAFALLHHVRNPDAVIAEMARVARLGLFVSDCNNFGHGKYASRIVKCLLRSAGLWRPFVMLRTRGKGFDVSEGDGASFSYSVFDSIPEIRRSFPRTYLLSTQPATSSYLRFATSHGALFATVDFTAAYPDYERVTAVRRVECG